MVRKDGKKRWVEKMGDSYIYSWEIEFRKIE
jgi:hypothetical protein